MKEGVREAGRWGEAGRGGGGGAEEASHHDSHQVELSVKSQTFLDRNDPKKTQPEAETPVRGVSRFLLRDFHETLSHSAVNRPRPLV